MNSFKLAFRAIQRQQSIRKRDLIINNNKINFFSNKTHNYLNSKLFKSKTKIIYNNHQKYLSISLIRFNEQSSGKTEEKKQADTSSEIPPKINTKQSWFTGFFDTKNNARNSGLAVFIFVVIPLGGWILTNWGAPQIDETGNIIHDEFIDCKNFYSKNSFFFSL
jgi:hypothetical protein